MAELDRIRPVVVASRDDHLGRRDQATVAAITTSIRDVPSQVIVDHRDGFREASAIACDVLSTIRKSSLRRRLGRLSDRRVEEFDRALRFALQLDEPGRTSG